MKQLILLLGLTIIVLNTNAQYYLRNFDEQEVKQNQQKTQYFSNTFSKTGEEVIWWEDFDGGLPDGWTIVDSSGYNMPWVWTTDSVYGAYTWGYIESETAENGFIALNAGGYNTVPQFDQHGVLSDTIRSVDSYFQTSPIDLTNYKNGVILQFHEQFRFFTGMHFNVEISDNFNPENPDTANWFTFNCNQWYTSEDPTWDGNFHIYFSPELISNNSIVLRFHIYGSSHYFICIDDIKFTIPNNNDAYVLNSWCFYNWMTIENSSMGIFQKYGNNYYKIPKSQILPFVGFQASVTNTGLNELTNLHLKTDIYYKELLTDSLSRIFTTNSEDTNLEANFYFPEYSNYWSYNFPLIFNETNYLPQDWGYYKIINTVIMDSTDDYPDDNSKQFFFTIDDSVYSRSSDSIASTNSIVFWYDYGHNNKIGVTYDIADGTKLEAIRWYFHEKNIEYSNLIADGYFRYKFYVYSYDENENDNWSQYPVISSLTDTLKVSDIGKWKTCYLPLNNNSNVLDAGLYLIKLVVDDVIWTYGGHNVGFYIGRGEAFPNNYWDYFTNKYNNEEYNGMNTYPAIQLIIAAENWTGNDGVSVEETRNNNTKDLILQQNYPNPASVTTVISYSIKKQGNIDFQVYNITGKLVFAQNYENISAGTHDIKLDISAFKSGVYYYTIKVSNEEMTKKMVVIK